MFSSSDAKLMGKLQSIFTGLIASNPKLPVLAPAFFMSELLTTIADDAFEPVEEPCPFTEFWIVYESNNPPFGTITNIVLIQGRQARLWTVVHGVSNVLRSAVVFDLDNPAAFEALAAIFNPRAIRETVPELRLTLNRINSNDHEAVVPPALGRLNAKRVKGQMKKLPPYIVVKQTRRVSEEAPVQDAWSVGYAVSPHDRRGHWRTYKATGRQVWVRDCSIHGGSKVPRDYRVQA
jgi:hypothetical protein